VCARQLHAEAGEKRDRERRGPSTGAREKRGGGVGAWLRAPRGGKESVGGPVGVGGGRVIAVGRPKAHSAVLQLIKDFQAKSNFKRSKAGPMLLQKFQIKYKIVGN
jgi:hypothetical protein